MCFFCTFFPALSHSNNQTTNKEIVLHWTDTGVYSFGKRPEYLKNPEKFSFSGFSNEVPKVLQNISPKGQILIPMPANKNLPSNEAQWKEYTNTLYRNIKERVSQGIESSVNNFEIRTVQNISIAGGYWAPWQQKRSLLFTKAFLNALSMVKNDLKNSNHSVSVLVHRKVEFLNSK